jgi:hypothetical protein
MSTTEKQAAHAHKVAQMVTDYHSKMAITKHKLTDNPSADIGIFNKLAPELRNKIYASLFEDVFQPDPNDTPCPCSLLPGRCEHTGSDVYKPLSHLRPFLSLLATCKLFRSEAQALLYVDYIPQTGWVARGEQGRADIREFLRSFRPEDRTKVQVAWRLEAAVGATLSLRPRIAVVAAQICAGIDLYDGSSIVRHKANPLHPIFHHHGTWSITTRRFYYGNTIDQPTGQEGLLVVNGPLQVIFWKERQKEDWEKESDERYRRIVRM